MSWGIQIGAEGRVGKEPEKRHMPNGDALLSFSIAVDNGTDRQTNQELPATWLDVSVFGERAEELAEQLGKGDRVWVSGREKVRTYTDKNGVEQTRRACQASVVQPLKVTRSKLSGSHPALVAAGAGVGAGDSEPDDIPF